jgi:hypothetical protein
MAPLGIVAGFIDAIGGGGWGPVTTPTLLTFGRLEPRRAIGSVSASEFLVSLAASIGFLRGLGGAGVDIGIVLALLLGGIAIAPLAALLVRRLHIRVTGTLVGSLVVLTNSRTLLQAAGLDGGARLVALVAIGGVGAALVAGTVRQSRAEAPAIAIVPVAG